MRSPKPDAASAAPGRSSRPSSSGGVSLQRPSESEHHRGRREREVEEEDPAPRDPFDERAAGGRPGDRGDARERRPEPDRAPRVCAVDAAQERERVRGQERARDALERPRDDQGRLVRRRAREQGGEREASRAGDEDRAAGRSGRRRRRRRGRGTRAPASRRGRPTAGPSGRGRGPPRWSGARR